MTSLSKELKIQNREGTPINLSMDAVIDYGFVDSVINKKKTRIMELFGKCIERGRRSMIKIFVMIPYVLLVGHVKIPVIFKR